MRYLWPAGGDVGMGVMAAPNMRGIPLAITRGASWAADLGCLDGPPFVKRCDVTNARLWLETLSTYHARCLFVTVPDVVGNSIATLAAYDQNIGRFTGWPLAYVAQDGAEDFQIPVSAHTVFIGGSTQWKLSNAAESVIERAIAEGRHIHVGRVNWWKRYAHFRRMPHSDLFTCDGTRNRYERDRALIAWRGYETQLPLWS